MPGLFDPDHHEALVTKPWDAGLAQGAVREIANCAVDAARGGLWPMHPLDAEGEAAKPACGLYLGAAGVLWALRHLASQGAIADGERFSRWIADLPASYRKSPDTSSVVPSYFLGETGVLLLALRAQPTEALADELFACVERNTNNPALEALWGAPGTMIAAVFAYELTGEERWRSLYLANVAGLMRNWRWHERERCDLWTQDLYGRKSCLFGAAHGFAGNVFSLLRGAALLSAATHAELLVRALHTLRATAQLDAGLANWPPASDDAKRLVQWCHGAPGMLTSFARAPASAELDQLLLQAGELVWQAGPLRKGSNLCHGTAGNGAALLALFTRTGDQLWLDRARRFAMHAAAQVAAARAQHGQGRYSLWTGDAGVAVYLWQCLTATSGMPSLDF